MVQRRSFNIISLNNVVEWFDEFIRVALVSYVSGKLINDAEHLASVAADRKG